MKSSILNPIFGRILLYDHKQAVAWMIVLLFVGGVFTAFLLADVPQTSASSEGRSAKGTLTKVPESRGKNLRGVDWRPGTDQAFMVGHSSVYMYNSTTSNLTILDGAQSTDHYYEDIAWRPQGDYAIIVGATPVSTRVHGVIAKLWYNGAAWQIDLLSGSIGIPLTGVAWSSDGSIAVIVGGARAGETQQAGTLMLRYADLSGLWSTIYTDSGPSGLSDVSYNPVLNMFFAVGLDGRMMTYNDNLDHDKYTFKNNSIPKTAEIFSISWRDNGGRAMMGGWFSGALKGYIYTTDGTYTKLVMEVQEASAAYVNDASWAPGSDYTLFVGQTGYIWEYSLKSGLTKVDNPFDTKPYFGVDFRYDGKVAIIVGSDGDIFRYDVSYPAKQNFAPAVVISSPHDNDAFDYGAPVILSSNGTHDDDLDPMTYSWTSSLNGSLSTQAVYETTALTTGKHMITLTVDDNNAHVSKAYINITIKSPKDPPKITAGSDKVGYVAEDVALDGKVLKSDFNIRTYEWDCQGTGDFRVTTDAKGECRYGDIGIYNATLRITDVRLAVATDIVMVTVFPKLMEAKSQVFVQTPGPLRQGEVLVIWINGSNSKTIDLVLTDPKGTDIPVGPRHLTNGTYYITFNVPDAYKDGMYNVKWRYHDHNDTKTDWYVVSNAIHIKKYNEVKGPDWVAIAAAIVVIVIIIIVSVVIVMFMMRREVVKLEAAVLFFRDGRVLSTFIPHDAAVPQTSAPQQAVVQPAPPLVAQPPLDQYGAPQYQPPPAQAPVAAVPPVPPMPSNEGTAQAQAAVQASINEIKQGTASRLPDKIILGHRKVLIELGQHTIMAVSLFGPEPANLRKGMRNSLQEIEIVYGNQLRNWDGLIHDMPRLQSIMEKEVKIKD
jgi:WD40 repeat protein